MGDDLFGTDNILRDIDDGLGAGQSTAARPERAWLLKHTIQAIDAHALRYISSQQQTDNDCAFHTDSDAPETLTSTKHFRSSILIFPEQREQGDEPGMNKRGHLYCRRICAISPLNGRSVSLSASIQYKGAVECVCTSSMNRQYNFRKNIWLSEPVKNQVIFYGPLILVLFLEIVTAKKKHVKNNCNDNSF